MPRKSQEGFQWENAPDPAELERKQKAFSSLETFEKVLEDAENIKPNEIVDLTKKSRIYPDLTMGDALKTALKGLKRHLDNLSGDNRQDADDMILSAEIYIAAYAPNKKEMD